MDEISGFPVVILKEEVIFIMITHKMTPQECHRKTKELKFFKVWSIKTPYIQMSFIQKKNQSPF